MHLKQFQGLLNQISKIVSLSLTVVNLITQVGVSSLEEVHDGENLAVVGHEGLSDGVTALDEGLQDVQCRHDDFFVARVQGRCNSQAMLKGTS